MKERIRQVRFAPYKQGPKFTLTLFDVHRRDSLGKSVLGYVLKQGEQVIFSGEDFACSPLHCIDSDDCVKALMGFLTLRIGDTDKEYFNKYTPEQLEFSEQHAEMLEMAVYDRFGYDS